jgi:hypothetical protein
MSDAAAQRRARQTITNLVLALGASVGLVIALVMIVPRDDTSLIKKIDYVSVAKDAATSTSKPVIVPKIANGWWSNSARWEANPGDGTDASWYVGFVGPKNQYIGMTQTYNTNPTWLAIQLSGIKKTGELKTAGRVWQIWQTKEPHVPAKTKDYMLVTSQANDTLLVYGTASESEMKAFATGVSEQITTVYP